MSLPLQSQAEDAENDPSLRAARKAEETARALKRDATLAASLLGVELSDDTDSSAASSAAQLERDMGNDIAEGGEAVSAEELARVGRGGGGSLDDFDFNNDASVDKLAALIAKRATDLPVSHTNSTPRAAVYTVGVMTFTFLGHLMKRIVAVDQNECFLFC